MIGIVEKEYDLGPWPIRPFCPRENADVGIRTGGKPIPPVHAIRTEFETEVTRLRLRKSQYIGSTELKRWCERNPEPCVCSRVAAHRVGDEGRDVLQLYHVKPHPTRCASQNEKYENGGKRCSLRNGTVKKSCPH